MVACKSLREYNNKQEKKQFCLEEKRQAKQRQQALKQGPSSASTKTPLGDQHLYSHEKLVAIAKKNQTQQQQKRQTQRKQKINNTKQQPRQQLPTQRRKKHTMPQKDSMQKESGKRKQRQKPNESFLTKSRAAALQQTKIYMENEQNWSFIRITKKN